MYPAIKARINKFTSGKTLDELIGVPNPAVEGTDTLMKYNKLLQNQLGTDNPTVADKTSVMNYLKLLEDNTPKDSYSFTPGIRSMGLDVGAINNGLGITNNVISMSSSITEAIFGSHFDGDVVDYVNGIVPVTNTSTSDTTNKVFGTASRAFSGTQTIEYADNTAFEVGSGDFYINLRARRTAANVYWLFGKCDVTRSANTNISYECAFDATGKVSFAVYVGGTSYEVKSTNSVSDTNFHEVRVGRAGNMIYAGLDGTVSTGVAVTGSVNDTTYKFALGSSGEYTTARLSGNIDEFIFVKGKPMNTTNYIVPVTPYSYYGYLLKSLTRLNLDRITFPKIYKPANTKCQVDVLGASIRANTATAGGNTTITLDASASAVDGFYVGNTIVLKTLTGAGQSRVITGYVGSTKVATVSTWTTNPANLTTFEIFQTIQSNISPGYDFSTIDYTVNPTVNVICSLEKQTGATASPMMGVPIVTSIEKDWVSQAPVRGKTALATNSTLLSASGKCRIDNISGFFIGNGYNGYITLTVDSVVVYNDLQIIAGDSTTAMPINIPVSIESSQAIDLQYRVNNTSGVLQLIVSYSK